MAVRRFGGFIDVHVHLRQPGATAKEDFETGTHAAVAGGYTFVIDMPNNPVPTVTPDHLKEKLRLCMNKAVCPVGFHYGTDGKNLSTFPAARENPSVYGLKVYLNQTTGPLLIEDDTVLDAVFRAWQSDKPILVHAEGGRLEFSLYLSKKYGRRLHVCHIAREDEVSLVRKAKRIGNRVTAGVTPHHLFLQDTDVKTLGPYALMKPSLGTGKDRDALWQGIGDATIDILETDHAPHTKEEKESPNPPYGVPGLETAAGLMFKAVHEGLLSVAQAVSLLHDRPQEIFRIRQGSDTYIELDPEKSWVIGQNGYHTRCGWSPFHGKIAFGTVEKVVIKGKHVFTDGRVAC